MESHAGRDLSADHALDSKDSWVRLHAPRQLICKLRGDFGDRFLCYLGLCYCGLKGVADTLQVSSMLPYFQRMQVSSVQFQLVTVVARIPWSMKGLMGVLSDCLPLGTYHKRGYLVLSALIGCSGLLVLVLTPESSLRSDQVWQMACCFCAVSIMVSTFDLLCEGKYTAMMSEQGAGGEILTFVWCGMQFGGLIAALVTAVFVDHWGPRLLLSFCLIFAVLGLWRSAAGDMPEVPARSWMSLRIKITSEPRLFSLAVGMALGSFCLALSAVYLSSRGRDITSVLVSLILIAGSFWSLPSTLAKGNLYMFIMSVAYIDVTGPLTYFYTSSTECILDGPHFSLSYYLAVSNVVGSLAGMLGSVLFQGMQAWSFRSAFLVTTGIQVVASIFDLLIVLRINTFYGVSDKVTYLFGDAACQSIAQMMALMPMALLTARLCPRGAEATVFAILAGFQNFGASIASVLGVHVTEMFGVKASADGPCNFEHLSSLLVFTHMICPLLCLPLTFVLISDAKMDDTEAFADMSPAPSFASPAPSSPRSPFNYYESPRSTRSGSRGNSVDASDRVGGGMAAGLHDNGDDYLLMEEDEKGPSERRVFA
mmetsp:Transcript_10002/g.22006  ORF Transcript_10002/g.22006 Transcript_10002/m.22006 type:complete len:595 (+) Transcript_10002:201-1985(+)|eukprot:CAMPEP_0206491466 /NCGR_PEP_ID=MMETSP0324_2-20121206/45026_1 /ASSEMBLY_ACC=CAM_ASM_000836 /TAXON_ID=2866 /ORGANISM="Crypthecodinium cohnii, Strain Seligo" /LENGTH=594 /DNA_ID=CAMNT_0053972689 /DNA_START=120 /DNA_END=1904 /DNA_ORIENTATION=-